MRHRRTNQCGSKTPFPAPVKTINGYDNAEIDFRRTTDNQASNQTIDIAHVHERLGDRRQIHAKKQRRSQQLLYHMSTTSKRERRTEGKQDRQYEKYFTPLLTESNCVYLQALYEQTQYELHHFEAYTATGQKNIYLQQETTTATTE